MENTLNSFKQWIYKTAKSNPELFKITNVIWPQKLGLEYYDYSIEININGKLYNGQGTDSDKDIAICKATSEAYERYCVEKLNLTNSNGCAVHYEIEKAKNNSKLELIERDAFLFRFISGYGFTETRNSLAIKTVSKFNNIDLYVYDLSNSKYSIFLTKIIFNHHMQIFGLGCDYSIEKACFQSEVEALRQWSYYKDHDLSKLPMIKDFVKYCPENFDQHGDLSFYENYNNQIKYLFENEKNHLKIHNLDLSEELFAFEVIELKNGDGIFADIPLHFVRCTHPLAQSLFVGSTLNNINSKRFSPLENPLNLWPHPFR